jgi:hypothetical protein
MGCRADARHPRTLVTRYVDESGARHCAAWRAEFHEDRMIVRNWGRGLGTSLVGAVVQLGLVTSPALADRPFAQRFAINEAGNIAVAANTLSICNPAVAGWPAARAPATS